MEHQTTSLLRAAKDGSQDALNQLYNRIGARLQALVRVRLGPSLLPVVEVEDVVQEVMIRAMNGLNAFEKDSSRSFFAWLAIIAGNVIRDLADYHQRGKRDIRRNTGIPSLPMADKHRSVLSALIADQELARLEKGLTVLSEKDREIILLRHFEERTFGEMASLLHKSEDACRMQFARAMARLTLAVQTT